MTTLFIILSFALGFGIAVLINANKQLKSHKDKKEFH